MTALTCSPTICPRWHRACSWLVYLEPPGCRAPIGPRPSANTPRTTVWARSASIVTSTLTVTPHAGDRELSQCSIERPAIEVLGHKSRAYRASSSPESGSFARAGLWGRLSRGQVPAPRTRSMVNSRRPWCGSPACPLQLPRRSPGDTHLEREAV
jgi:hypothetical protein